MKVSWDDEIPNIWKQMFQTTNQNLFGSSEQFFLEGMNQQYFGYDGNITHQIKLRSLGVYKNHNSETTISVVLWT